ncbi:MAG: S8 family serine peptidase, partial [Candidatus Thorarchaeota archaeon]
MRKKMLSSLIIFILTIPLIPFFVSEYKEAESPLTNDGNSIDFVSLEQEYGLSIPLVVCFNDDLSDDIIRANLQAIGITYSFGDLESSQIGPYHLLRGSKESYSTMIEVLDISYIAPQTSCRYTESTRDTSIPEINATLVWQTVDELDRNVTGRDILIADLDTGIDWTHPDFWFANGSAYNWGESVSDGTPSNGSDFIDLNDSGTGSANETLRFIDLADDGYFNVSTDWIWAENLTQDGIPNIGEPFFVVEDTNGNDLLDLGEQLIMLNMPKTRYIVEADGTPSRNVRSWVRGVNLTSSTHEDTDGHGTSVSGILLGGQIGYRKYVGVAPDAELMMVKVLGASNEWLTIEEGLAWAYNHGADVILIEVGSWTYQYLDGSSATESFIDTIVSNGVPVIAPSGNLGGMNKHALFEVPADNPHQVDFHVPSDDPHIEDVYITVLSVNTTDFDACNFSVIINFAAWGGPLVTIYLHPGSGYQNFNPESPIVFGPNILNVESFTSISSRSTSMLGIHISATTAAGIPNTDPPNGPPYHQVNVTAPQQTTFHCYISDDQSSWSGGAVWMTDISDGYEI